MAATSPITPLFAVPRSDPFMSLEGEIGTLAGFATILDIVLDSALFGRKVDGETVQFTMSADQEQALLVAASRLTDTVRELRRHWYELHNSG